MMEQLGFQRRRVIACLYGNMPSYGHLFSVEDHETVFDAFRRFVLETDARWSTDTDPLRLSLVAVGQLLSGHLPASQRVLDLLPDQPYALEHGAGWCQTLPVKAFKTALPVPGNLDDTDRWLAGSPEQSALREWLTQHHGKLNWIEAEGRYQLGN